MKRLFRGVLLALLITLPLVANAADKYYILDNTSPTWPKYPTGAAACLRYREVVEDAHAENNPGGVTTVKQWPNEGVSPDLKTSTYCIINWTRTVNGQTSSFDYYRSVYAGMCDAQLPLNLDIKQCGEGIYVSIETPRDTDCGGSCNSIGDPVDPASGRMYFEELDISASDNGIGFKRYFNNATGVSSAGGEWLNSYGRHINPKYSPLSYQPYVQDGSKYSSLYSDLSSACTQGFNQIKSKVSRWSSASVSYSNGICSVKSGSATIGTLKLLYAGQVTPFIGSSAIGYEVVRDNGQVISFIVSGSTISPPPGTSMRLQKTSSGYVLTDGNDTSEQYDDNGRLITIVTRAGVTKTMAYDAQGRLSTVTDSFGHQLIFGYDSQGRITDVTYQ